MRLILKFAAQYLLPYEIRYLCVALPTDLANEIAGENVKNVNENESALTAFIRERLGKICDFCGGELPESTKEAWEGPLFGDWLNIQMYPDGVLDVYLCNECQKIVINREYAMTMLRAFEPEWTELRCSEDRTLKDIAETFDSSTILSNEQVIFCGEAVACSRECLLNKYDIWKTYWATTKELQFKKALYALCGKYFVEEIVAQVLPPTPYILEHSVKRYTYPFRGAKRKRKRIAALEDIRIDQRPDATLLLGLAHALVSDYDIWQNGDNLTDQLDAAKHMVETIMKARDCWMHPHANQAKAGLQRYIETRTDYEDLVEAYIAKYLSLLWGVLHYKSGIPRLFYGHTQDCAHIDAICRSISTKASRPTYATPLKRLKPIAQ